MPIDEKAVWQRVAATAKTAPGDPLGDALEEASALLGAASTLSTGKAPWPELLRSQRQTLRALRGLGRLLGRSEESAQRKLRLSGKSYREKLLELISRQEHQARALDNLSTLLGDPAARVVTEETGAAWARWRLLLMELGR